MKNKEVTDNFIKHSQKKKEANVFEQKTTDLSPLRFKGPQELKMPECVNKDNDKSCIRMSELNLKSKIDIWMSKNSFMPSLAPLPSLMKKFGDQVKEDKKRRETYCPSQFQSPLLVNNKNSNISQPRNEREESNKSMLYSDNFIGKRIRGEKPLSNLFK